MTRSPDAGSDYRYPLSDYADEAARVLGAGWWAESGFLGSWAVIRTTDGRVAMRLYVSFEGELCLENLNAIGWSSRRHTVPTSGYHTESAPRTPKELRPWAAAIATKIQTLTRRYRLDSDLDF